MQTIVKDIQGLDCAKRHMATTMGAFRKLHMLVRCYCWFIMNLICPSDLFAHGLCTIRSTLSMSLTACAKTTSTRTSPSAFRYVNRAQSSGLDGWLDQA